jgi:hypothetical protein
MPRRTWIRILALAVGLPVAVALGWWLLTPAGLPGSLAGVFILTGVIVFFVGLGRAGGMDTALDNIHPGSNVGQMAEQGLNAERRFLGPRRRWAGTLVMLSGAAYVALGALFWNLR